MSNDNERQANLLSAAIDTACARSGLDNRTIAHLAGLSSVNRLMMLRRKDGPGRFHLSEIPGLAAALELRAVDLLVLYLKDVVPTLYDAVAPDVADRKAHQERTGA